MNIRKHAISSLITLLLILGISALLAGEPSSAETRAVRQQELIRLESRMSQLEQRLYVMDANIQRLQQAAVSGAANRNSGRDPEVMLLTSQLQVLQQHLNEVDCSLARLDERTLTPAAKQARAKADGDVVQDPCRLNPNTPLQVK